MKLVIAYTPTKLRPEVKQLGDEMGAIFENVSHSQVAYGELVSALWAKGEGFLLCEHDVVATSALLGGMWNCGSWWCAGFAWRYSGAVMPGESPPQHPIRERETALFCNKFSASLLARTPNVIGAVRGLRWTQIDLVLLPMLKQAGAGHHLHGPITHLRQQHPAWAATMTEDDWGRVDG